jgi:seryl-tRNA synthetase
LKFKSDLENSENNLKLQEEILRNLPRLEMNKKRQEIEDIKRKIYKIQANISKSEAQAVKLRSNFDELKVKAPFLIHPTQLLGKDKDRNLYFV